jgi:hypothetical protein
MSTPFTLRRAELTDVQTLIDLRIAYLREVEGFGDDVDLAALEAATRRYFIRKMPSSDYVAWVAMARPAPSPEQRGRLHAKVIGTAGLFMVDRPPSPGMSASREAHALIGAFIENARRANVRRILVDDTPRGRQIYERAGFTIVSSIMELTW